jgi:hypothetical protein
MNKEHLKYHRHLGQIADADLNYIKLKDCQYDASWKKRGGPGAWFTIVRPWDRLSTFMEQPKEGGGFMDGIPRWNQHDIFGAVRAEGLEGPDGSVIACIRDLRRYLLLVEAHMTEELSEPSAGHVFANVAKALGDLDFAKVEERISSWVNNVTEDDSMEDMYGKLAAEAGITRQEAKLRIIRTLYGGGEWPKGYEGGDVELAAGDEVAVVLTNTPRAGESEEQTLARTPEGRSELARRKAETKGPISWGDQSQHQRRVPRYPEETTLQEPSELEPPQEEQSMLRAEDTEPDAKWPWISSWSRVSALGPQCWDAWHRSGADVVSLEPRLGPSLWAMLPPRVRQCYSPVIPADETAPTAFWLRVWEAPADERDRWRTLATELNFKEWTDSMEYGELYKWYEGPGKYILRPEWQGWKAQ